MSGDASDQKPNGDAAEGVGASPAAVPSARPRARPTALLAQQIAELLAEPHSHALGACAKLRIHYNTYKRWLSYEPDDHPDMPELAEFQGIVLEALDAARVADVENFEADLDSLGGPGVAKAGAYVNKHTFHHLNRFKRFYANDDEPKKAELDIGNKDGKPFKSHVSGALSESTRRAILTGIVGIPEEMIDVGAKAGEEHMSSLGDESEG